MADMGRPTDYSEEIAAKICALIATSSDGLRKICEENSELPCPSTIYLWLTKNESFSEQYARAREDQAQLLADEIVSIADTTQVGVVVTEKAEGTETKHADMIEHRKLRIEARKWVASKLLPKKYGDKQQVEHTGKLTLEQLLTSDVD